MIEAFESDKDVHRLTAAMIFGKPYDEISNEDGSSSLGDGRQSERYWGKKSNHALNYDLGYRKFALQCEIMEREAKWLVEKYHAMYPGVRQNYHAMIQNQLKKDRTITNLFGRKRIFLGPVIPNPPKITKYACTETYKDAYAHLPQSTTADKINEQGLNFVYYNQQWFKPVELLTQIHDSIVFQIPLSLPWEVHADILLRIKESLESPMEWRGTKIIIPADLSIGFNMCKDDMKELKSKEIPSSPTLFADKLSQIYSSLRS